MDDYISRSGHVGGCPVILSMKLIPILLLSLVLSLGLACSSKRMTTGNNPESLSTPTLDLLTAIDKENISIIKQHIDAGTNINDYPIPEGLPFEGAQPLHRFAIACRVNALHFCALWFSHRLHAVRS